MNDAIIRTEALTKRYSAVTAVDHLDLEIRRGEVFGLLGPNGAGKTTTTLMLLGMTEPTAGTAFIDGYNCTRDPISVKRITGYLPDSVGFYPDMTGRENLRFTGALNGLSGKAGSQRADELLERVGMTYAAHRKAGTYSRGMKQRLGVADVLMKDPKVIIMDEPTLGIDPEGIRELMILIRELASQDGRTILISSHQLYQVQQICDRVGIFVQGKLIACGHIGQLARQLQSEGLYLLDVRTDRPGALQAALEPLSGVKTVTPGSEGTLHVESSRDICRDLTALAAENGCALLELHQRGGDLEEIYRNYFEKAGDSHDAAEPPSEEAGKRSTLGAALRRRFFRK